MRLSIIIPVLNDHQEVNNTIASIRQTAGQLPEIIVVDDASQPPVELVKDVGDTKLIRLDTRVGAGQARHIGAVASSGTHLLLLDSHMRFEQGWYETAMNRITQPGRENVVHCGSCCGLEPEDMVMEMTRREVKFGELLPGQRCQVNGVHVRKISDTIYTTTIEGVVKPHSYRPEMPAFTTPVCRYYGALLNICGPNPNTIEEFQVLEGVWAPELTGDDYELSCLMGACYFFNRDWFFKIGGLKANKQWGGEEPYLSLKTYLAGGSIRMMKSVRIGHKFHSGRPPYRLFVEWKNYNKVRTLMTCFNEAEYKSMIRHLGREPGIRRTMDYIYADTNEIQEEGQRNRDLFVNDVEWYCNRFGIKHPLK